MYSFEQFQLQQMVESGKQLRELGTGCASMEEAAGEVVDFLFEAFLTEGPDSGAEPACVLVRCFKTHRFDELPADLQEAALTALNGQPADPAMPCLTLLATRGVQPEWNSRQQSSGHRAIPLATKEMLLRAPMIARLVEQVGLQPRDILHATPESLVEMERHTLDVFHVEFARGSIFVPAQTEFVVPFGVRSVLGFGGLLPSGELFFVVMFTRVRILPETADLFRTVALNVKLVLLGHAAGPIFST